MTDLRRTDGKDSRDPRLRRVNLGRAGVTPALLRTRKSRSALGYLTYVFSSPPWGMVSRPCPMQGFYHSIPPFPTKVIRFIGRKLANPSEKANPAGSIRAR